MSTPTTTGPGGIQGDVDFDQFEEQFHTDRLPRWTSYTVGACAVAVVLLLRLGLGSNVALAIFIGWVAFAVALVGLSWIIEGGRRARDKLATTLITSAFVVALLPLASLLWKVVSNGAPQVTGAFLSDSMRNVIGQGGGIYHAIMGTLLITLMTALLSVPIGLLTAIYLVEYGGGRLAKAITFLVDVMTGIPSIVAGLFAYALFAIFLGAGVRMGFAGAVALSVLMIPLVVRSTEEMLKLVPHELREASYALGVPKWRTILKVVLPTSLAGIITGVTIAVARVIGETAPLLIICGFTDSTNFNLFNGRIMTLPVFIYESFKNPGYPPDASVNRAWGAAFILLLIVMLLSLIARLVSRFFSPKTKA